MKHLYVFLVCVIALASCGEVTPKTPVVEADPVVTPAPVEASGAVTSSAKSLDTLMALLKPEYKKNDTFLSCVENNIDNCIRESSYQSGQEPACDDFIIESNRVNCKDNNTFNQAMKEKDVSLCAGLTNNKESCEYEVILQKAYVSLDVVECEKVADSYKVSCHNQVIIKKATEKKDAALCETIKAYALPDGSEDEAAQESIKYERERCEQEVEILVEMEKQEKERMQALEEQEKKAEAANPITPAEVSTATGAVQ